MNTYPRQEFDPGKNHLLAALPHVVWRRWQTSIDPVQLRLDQVLCESRETPAWVYFPTTAIVSLMCLTRNGQSTELAVSGNESIVGMPMFMGGDASTWKAVVQSAGHALRLPMQVLKTDMDTGGPVLDLILRYTQGMIAQVAQAALCNRLHSLEQQLCRRLLLGLDRVPSDELELTHERAASLLGVRRESVTGIAHKLHHAGIVRYSRGHIVVLDRHQLEQRACECYAVAKGEYRRLLPMPLAA